MTSEGRTSDFENRDPLKGDGNSKAKVAHSWMRSFHFENRDPLKGDGNSVFRSRYRESDGPSALKTETRLKGMETGQQGPAERNEEPQL